MDSRRSDNFIYSGNVTLTPCPLITWTAGGEFYRNQIETGRYKEMLMLDTKLTFNISKRIEISASVTNLLNKKVTHTRLMGRFPNMSGRASSVVGNS